VGPTKTTGRAPRDAPNPGSLVLLKDMLQVTRGTVGVYSTSK
jgi:hypothetical protein